MTEGRRRRHLFPRTVGDVITAATKPLMHKQGKIYTALLRDWTSIVGQERAAVTRPERLQFRGADTQEAILHLAVRPAAAPELAYVTDQILEQCARYFGYRAVTRIVLHPTHGTFTTREEQEEKVTSAPASALSTPATPLPSDLPPEMRGVLERIANHVSLAVVKKNETR